MGDVIRFTGKRLSGFIPDPEYPNLPEPFCKNYKDTRKELAGLITPVNDTSPSEYLAPPDDCA